MAEKTPVDIGTKGTIGSLIMQEIEFFSRLELDCRNSSKIPCQSTERASTNCHTRPSFKAVIKAQKKNRGSNRLLPSMCSIVEVTERNQPIGLSKLSYRHLKTDAKRLHV